MFNLDLIWLDLVVFDFLTPVYFVSAALAAVALMLKEAIMCGRRAVWTRVCDILLGSTLVGAANTIFVALLLWLMTG